MEFEGIIIKGIGGFYYGDTHEGISITSQLMQEYMNAVQEVNSEKAKFLPRLEIK